jgi:hypothetical protein
MRYGTQCFVIINYDYVQVVKGTRLYSQNIPHEISVEDYLYNIMFV